MLRAITAVLQERNINDPVLLRPDGMTLTVGIGQEDHETVYDVECVTYIVESADFASFLVGNQDDTTRLHTISSDSEGTTQ